MTIYDIQVLSERTIQNFKPTRLAIKELVGHFYFCKSTTNNIENYTGSGVIWKKRIKKYGKEKIKTLWVSDWYHNPYEIQEVALHFSKENKIVESPKWDNLWPENGLNGGIMNAKRSQKSKDVRAKQNGENAANYDATVYHFIHKSGLIEVMPRLSLIQKHSVNPGNLTLMIHGKRPHANGWSLILSHQ